MLLVHPGGPFWRTRWSGWWQVPKGEIEPNENPLDAARREFAEELGTACVGPAVPLGTVRQAGGKVVAGFGVEGELDPTTIRSATFELEWPPRSGKVETFPEIDLARWFDADDAGREMLPSQRPFLDRLLAQLSS